MFWSGNNNIVFSPYHSQYIPHTKKSKIFCQLHVLTIDRYKRSVIQTFSQSFGTGSITVMFGTNRHHTERFQLEPLSIADPNIRLIQVLGWKGGVAVGYVGLLFAKYRENLYWKAGVF